MRAVRVHETGGPETLRYDEVPVPEPAAGQARVRVEAAGVNFIDVYQRSGLYPRDLPAAMGLEGAGTVEALGSDITELRVGERVAWAMQPGAYAEAALLDSGMLIPIPDGVETQTAAAVMLQGMTAHYLSHSTYPLQAGETTLVHAAAGGVGQLLTQIAKRLGARVIGTVSTDEKEALAREAGADEVIRYDRVDPAAEARRLTDGEGVHVVYDSVGQATFAGSLDALRPRGCLALFGQSSGPVPAFDPQILNAKGSLFLTRPSLGHYVATREELLRRAGDLYRWIAAGELRVRVDTTFPLRDAADAHRYLEERRTKGKVLLIP